MSDGVWAAIFVAGLVMLIWFGVDLYIRHTQRKQIEPPQEHAE